MSSWLSAAIFLILDNNYVCVINCIISYHNQSAIIVLFIFYFLHSDCSILKSKLWRRMNQIVWVGDTVSVWNATAARTHHTPVNAAGYSNAPMLLPLLLFFPLHRHVLLWNVNKTQNQSETQLVVRLSCFAVCVRTFRCFIILCCYYYYYFVLLSNKNVRQTTALLILHYLGTC